MINSMHPKSYQVSINSFCDFSCDDQVLESEHELLDCLAKVLDQRMRSNDATQVCRRTLWTNRLTLNLIFQAISVLNSSLVKSMFMFRRKRLICRITSEHSRADESNSKHRTSSSEW
jgi:hypothetical protein